LCCHIWIIFSRRSWLKATPTEGLTGAITYATLSSSKQLLNDVIFISFIDKNLFALATMKANCTHPWQQRIKKHVGAKRYLAQE